MYACAPSPEPETVIGRTSAQKISSPSSSWKMCDRKALRRVNLMIAVNAFIFAVPRCA